MKKIVAGIALLGAAASAQAADLPVSVPSAKAPAAIAMVYDWTGFYVGVNAGIGIGRDYTKLSVPNLPSFEASYLNPLGAMGGGQIGYNWQVPTSLIGDILFGAEADIQGTGMSDNQTCLLSCTLPGGPASQFNQRLDWFGTVRGRVGLVTGPVLSYLTAGWAYGNVKTTLSETIGTTAAFSSNQNRGGWTWGSGVEASLGGDWTAKLEYLWLTLGDRTDSFTLNTLPQTMTGNIREQIFRVGLNYRINGNGAAYVPPPASNWTGFYVGGNVGSGTGRDRSVLNVGGAAGASEFFNLSPDGINGGAQAGYNWQAANWVFGVEADFQASMQRDNSACVRSCVAGVAPFANNFTAYDATLPWFATARGRVGYSIGSTLLYGTGGYAYGKVRTRITTDIGLGPVTSDLSNNRGGWTAGGGFETPFTLPGLIGPNWTSKTEYLYVDLGTQTGAFTIPGLAAATSSTQIHEHILRSSLSYHFNSPVIAKY